MRKIKDNSLYLVISEECGRGRGAPEIAKAAIAGGVDMIQMREKSKPREELVRLGKKLAGICKKGGAAFIVNDDPVMAIEVNADGVHLGQEDLARHPVKRVRKEMGSNKIIGVSTHSVEEFKKANNADVDYIAYGPIFQTKTKDYFLGAKDVEEVLKIARKPVFFIGGINFSNVGELLEKGANNVAVIRAIVEADDIKRAAEGLKRALGRMGI